MPDLRVDDVALRRTTDSLRAVAAAAGELHPDAVLRLAAGAVPGGRLAEAAEVEAAEWRTEVAGLARAVDEHAAALERGAEQLVSLEALLTEATRR